MRTSKGGRVLLVCRRCVEEIHLEGGERDIPQKWSFSYIYFPSGTACRQYSQDQEAEAGEVRTTPMGFVDLEAKAVSAVGTSAACIPRKSSSSCKKLI